MAGQVVVAVYRVHWGLSVRPLLGSSTQLSHSIPPPTTLVGALGEAAAKIGLMRQEEFVFDGKRGLVFSSAVNALKELRVRWATAGWLSPFAQTTTTIRYFTGPYQSKLTLQQIASQGRGVSNLWAPIGLGYVASPRGLLQVVFLTERPEDVARVSLHVSRIGSKESMVDPVYVATCKLEEVKGEGKPVLVKMAAPWKAIKYVDGAYVREQVPWPVREEEWMCWYSVKPGACRYFSVDRLSVLKEAIVPVPPGGVRVLANNGYKVFKPASCNPMLELVSVKLSAFIAPLKAGG